ncbi:MAG: flagellar hook-length control protein FliK [Desulfobacteraceae bacterium]
MFVELPSQGMTTDIEKIAIKMPKGQGEEDACTCGEFADIINALMSAVPEDELQQSLEDLEWVEMEEGDISGMVPLIDLTQDQIEAIGMAKRLLNEAAPETVRPAETLKSILLPDQGQMGNPMEQAQAEAGVKESARETAFQNGLEKVSDRIPETTAAPSVLGEQPEVEVQPVPAAKQAADMIKPNAPIDPMPNAHGEKTKPAVADFLAGKEMPPAMQNGEGKEFEGRSAPRGKIATAATALQQPAGQPSPEPRHDQQWAGDSDPESELFSKDDTKTRSGIDVKTGFTDSSAETTTDSNDLLTKADTVHRESINGSITKTRAPVSERMEGVSGGKETNPAPAQNLQTNVIRQIVQQMTLHSQGRQSTMTIKLKPEFLGQVQMQISTDHHQVMVRMATESMAVKEMVEQGLQHLKTELQQHGLQIDKFDVFVANDNDMSKQGKDWAGFRQGFKRRQNSRFNGSRGIEENGEVSISSDTESRQPNTGVGEVDYFV